MVSFMIFTSSVLNTLDTTSYPNMSFSYIYLSAFPRTTTTASSLTFKERNVICFK
jgi:hypothetical protein